MSEGDPTNKSSEIFTEGGTGDERWQQWGWNNDQGDQQLFHARMDPVDDQDGDLIIEEVNLAG